MDGAHEGPSNGVSGVLERIADRLKPLGTLRDGLLVAAGFVYILGYLVWAFNAWQKNLGLLPALEFQYLIAGIAPVLAVLGVYFAVRGVMRIRERVRFWLGPDVAGWRRGLRWILLVAWGAAAFVILLVVSNWFQRIPFTQPELRDSIVLVTLLIFAVTTIFLPPSRSPRDRLNAVKHPLQGRGFPATIRRLHFLRFYLRPTLTTILVILGMYYVIVFAVGIPSIGLINFVEGIYPQIPQEFGGVRPRCAYLDLAKMQLSPETRREILPKLSVDPAAQIVRSAKVYVFFSSGDFMLLSPQKGNEARSPQIYEIKRSVIQAVVGCEE